MVSLRPVLWVLALCPILCGALSGGNDSSGQEIRGGRLTQDQITTELRTEIERTLLRVRFQDERYLFPEHRWMERVYLPYFKEYLGKLNLTFTEDGFDHDNYAFLFKTFLGLSNYRGGGSVSGEVACGIANIAFDTSDVKGLLDVRAKSWQQILVRTDSGWFVVDPRQVSLTPLKAFAVEHYIKEVYF